MLKPISIPRSQAHVQDDFEKNHSTSVSFLSNITPESSGE